jgi:hypothetical protein
LQTDEIVAKLFVPIKKQNVHQVHREGGRVSQPRGGGEGRQGGGVRSQGKNVANSGNNCRKINVKNPAVKNNLALQIYAKYKVMFDSHLQWQ